MRISDWSSDVCSSDLAPEAYGAGRAFPNRRSAIASASSGGAPSSAARRTEISARTSRRAAPVPFVDSPGTGLATSERLALGRGGGDPGEPTGPALRDGRPPVPSARKGAGGGRGGGGEGS